MNEYKIVYEIKRDCIDFDAPRGNFTEFEIIEAQTARHALKLARDRAMEYNQEQDDRFKNTMAIPDIKTVKDIVRL